MREKLIALANDVCTARSILPALKDLVEIFDKLKMYNEECGTLERIWHKTQKHDLLQQMGDVYFSKIGDYNTAIIAYNRYLEFTQPDLFRKYATSMYKAGYKKYDFDNEDYSRKIINLTDRYNILLYIIASLYEMKDIDAVLSVKDLLFNVKKKIDKIYNKLTDGEKAYVEELDAGNSYISGLFSNIKHHNDLNSFAIELDPKNEDAYINIMADHLTYGRKQEALEYYNKMYTANFNYKPLDSVGNVAWILSNFYSKKHDFFEAVMMQKLALEIDMAEQGE